MPTPDRYAVMGHPVAHSRSPFIHAEFARRTDQALTYTAIDVEPGRFAEAVGAFRADGGRGLNVTLPFKEEAWALADCATSRAVRARAANTLWFEGDRSHGDNTDGVGLIRDLRVNHGLAIAGRRVLLVGAGGAARGVVGALLDERPAELLLANRTVARARALCASLDQFSGDQFSGDQFSGDQFPGGFEGDAAPSIEAVGFEGLAGRRFDLVINATSASLGGAVPPLPEGVLAPGACAYDLMYGREPTAFVRWARARGARAALDGLGMLVEQAAESFLRWRGVRPETAPVIARLRGQAR